MAVMGVSMQNILPSYQGIENIIVLEIFVKVASTSYCTLSLPLIFLGNVFRFLNVLQPSKN